MSDPLCHDAQDLQRRNARGDDPAAAACAPAAAEDTRPLDDLLNFIEAGERGGGDATGSGKSKPRAKPKARPKQAVPAGGQAAGGTGRDAEGQGQGSGAWGRSAECEPSTSGRAASPPRVVAGVDRESGHPDPAASLAAKGRVAGPAADAAAANGLANRATANGDARAGATRAGPSVRQTVGPWPAEAAGERDGSASSAASSSDEWDASDEEVEQADLDGLGPAQGQDPAAQELTPRLDLDWVVRACRCIAWL